MQRQITPDCLQKYKLTTLLNQFNAITQLGWCHWTLFGIRVRAKAASKFSLTSSCRRSCTSCSKWTSAKQKYFVLLHFRKLKLIKKFEFFLLDRTSALVRAQPPLATTLVDGDGPSNIVLFTINALLTRWFFKKRAGYIAEIVFSCMGKK
jgi:hypothetical protein